MANRNAQQRGGQHSQNQGRESYSNRGQMGQTGQGYRGQQSAFQDYPTQFGGHYGGEDNYSGSRQLGGFDPRADMRPYQGNYETNARGDEYFNPQSNAREPWEGESSGSMGGASYTSGHQHRDPDYLQWRNEQMRNLDEDYDAWRKERYTNFSNDFGEWRKNRKSNPSKSAGSAGSDQSTESSSSSKTK